MSCNRCATQTTPTLAEMGIAASEGMAVFSSEATTVAVWEALPRCPTCKAWVSPRTGVCNNGRCAAHGQQVVAPTGWPPEGVRWVSGTAVWRLRDSRRQHRAHMWQRLAHELEVGESLLEGLWQQSVNQTAVNRDGSEADWQTMAGGLFQYVQGERPSYLPPRLAYAYAQVAEVVQERWWQRFQRQHPTETMVEHYSQTRQQSEQIQVAFQSPSTAEVTSRSGNSYTVTHNHCTCPDHRYRRRDCRHMEAARSAAVQIGVTPFEHGGWPPYEVIGESAPTLPAPAWAERYRLLQARREQEEAERRAREAEWLALYQQQRAGQARVSESEEAYQQVLADAQQWGELLPPYETENVLNGADVTFGVEIEVEFPNSAAQRQIVEALRAAGLTQQTHIQGYHGVRHEGMVAIEHDSSLSRHGVEIIMPPLRDRPEDWEKLAQVCRLIEDAGGRTSRRCGGHVHIGSEPMDSDAEQYQRLLQTYAAYQDVLYRMATDGEHRGAGRNYNYSRPFHPQQLQVRFANVDDVRARWHRTQGLNLRRAGGNNSNTVEFRLFDGAVDARRIQANIKMATAIFSEARRGAPIETMPSPQAVGSGRQDGVGGELRFRRFLDLFPAHTDRVRMAVLYQRSQWQPAS